MGTYRYCSHSHTAGAPGTCPEVNQGTRMFLAVLSIHSPIITPNDQYHNKSHYATECRLLLTTHELKAALKSRRRKAVVRFYLPPPTDGFLGEDFRISCVCRWSVIRHMHRIIRHVNEAGNSYREVYLPVNTIVGGKMQDNKMSRGSQICFSFFQELLAGCQLPNFIKRLVVFCTILPRTRVVQARLHNINCQ